MTSSKRWRQFEKLVARIEEAATPVGAAVTSPDRIPELATGILREVDVAIRYKVGTVELLITIECRDHERPGGRSWIDQLAGKRDAIGASKTIAVSRAGFTKPAIVAARTLGIELRKLSEVTVSDISRWFIPGAVHFCRLFENTQCNIVLYEKSGEPSQYAFTLTAGDVEKPMFYCSWIKSPFPIINFLPILEAAEPERFASIPFDGTKIDIKIPISWNQGQLTLSTTDGQKSVYLVELIVKASYQSAVCDIASGTHHEYAGNEGTKIQHSTFKSDWMGKSVNFHHQSDESGTQHVSVEFDADD